MKKTLTLAALAALGTIAAPVASATYNPSNPWHWDTGNKSAAHVEVQVSDYWNGGWCNNGQPASAMAIKTTDGTTKTVPVEFNSSVNGKLVKQTENVVVTPRGVVLAYPWAGADLEVDARLYPDSSDSAKSVDANSINTSSCAGLPAHMPGLPTSWAASTKPAKPVVTPTKPAPTKTTSLPTKPVPVKTTTAPVKPVVTPTKPAPSTSKATATATVKVTTPGGVKTTSTSGVVPVTKPVPAGGVTATATVKVPSKGITATATETVKPITPSRAGAGPKVQTDGASSNNSLETELAGAGALAAIAGAGVFVARRRNN